QPLVKIDESVGRPKLAADFLSSHHFSRAIPPHEKKLSGLLLQPDAQTSLAQLPGCGVHLKDSETEDSRRFFRLLHSLILRKSKYSTRDIGKKSTQSGSACWPSRITRSSNRFGFSKLQD